MAACYCNRCTSCIYDGWGDSECGSLEQSLTPERIVDGVFRLGELPRTTVVRHSGAGMNMKVGAPVRSKSGGGAPIRSEAPEIFLGVLPLHFLALKAQLVVLESGFVTVSTVWSSVSCLLFFLLAVPPVPSHL